MACHVEFTPRAISDLDEICRWVTARAPYGGPLWFDHFAETILSLGSLPERCPEVSSISTPEDTIRRLVFGRKQTRYAVYYAVFGDVVRILHVRHGARGVPKRQDLLR